MDKRTFISELVKALAWPLVTVVIVCLLRKPLSELLILLRKLKWGELEATFDKNLKAAKAEVEETIPKTKAIPPESNAVLAKARELSAISPAAAIVEIWREVERVAKESLGKSLFEKPSRMPIDLARQLESEGLLLPQQRQSYDRLRQLRNLATHAGDREITRRDVDEYGKLAVQFLEFLVSKAKATPPSKPLIRFLCASFGDWRIDDPQIIEQFESHKLGKSRLPHNFMRIYWRGSPKPLESGKVQTLDITLAHNNEEHRGTVSYPDSTAADSGTYQDLNYQDFEIDDSSMSVTV